MGSRIRSHDWAATPLGTPETWPQSLRSAVSILLPSKAQIALFWGPDLITLYNDSYRPTFGKKHPWALGLPIREAWSELWGKGLREMFAGVMDTGEAFWARDHLFELERHGFAEETYFDVSYDPVRDESNAVGGVFCIVSETTGRVIGDRRARSLRDLGGRTANARSAREACFAAVASLRGNPHDVPFALLYLTERAGEEPALVARTDGIPAPLTALARWRWPDAMQSDEIQIVDLAPGDGAPAGPWTRPVQRAAVVRLRGTTSESVAGLLVVGLSPMLAFNDDYRGYVEVMAGQVAAAIANAEAYEAERRRAESLAELNRAKTTFFSNVSHEFRTPLTLMLGPLEEALADAGQLPPEQRERLELAHRNSQRLQKLVNTLLDFSRIEAGRTEASFQATDLAALTTDLASAFRSAMERAGLRFDVRCEPVGEPVYVDREMWEKIVFNLLSNALKFTHEGTVELTLRRHGRSVILSVRDTGTGIAKDEQPRVFERFHQARGARGRSMEGTGIGLALVKELVRLHGGTIALESQVNRGSRFTVGIPLGWSHLPHERLDAPRNREAEGLRAEAWAQEALGWLPPEPVAAASGPAAAGRILLADDNADMRQFVRRILQQRYQVEVVEDGEAALTAARERLPDLIISDVMMPGLDGFGLLDALRSDERLRSIPVILLSARAGEEARVEGVRAGADDYLVKPFSAKELMARVSSRLALRTLEKRIERDRSDLQDLFGQTPVPIAVMRGPELVFELANPAFAEVVGRDVTGRPFLAALPEAAGQGFDDLLRQVMTTGVSHVGREVPVRLERGGALQDLFFTFVYAPLRGPDGEPDRVIAICNEVTAEVQARALIAQSAQRYRNIFETAGVAIWEEDFSAVKEAVEELRRAGVQDIRQYCIDHPEFVRHAVGLVRILDVNAAAVQMLDASGKGQLLESLHHIFVPETLPAFIEEMVAIADGRASLETESVVRSLQGRHVDVLLTITFPPGPLRSVLVTLSDITARKVAERAVREEASILETLNRVGHALAAESDLERVVQVVTDAATEVSGAKFGAFFYNVKNEAGESYMLYTLSGAARESFAGFGMPRNTAVFAPTFEGQGIIRLDDVTADPRYGRNAPHKGMPAGHLPVRSYLAVPVISRSGEVLGGLFFGHPEPAVFTERAEHLVSGIAAQAAVAIDNARLHRERVGLIGRLQEADRRKDEFIATLSHELRNPLAPLRNSLAQLRLIERNAVRLKLAEIMERQVDHLVRLVDDLLEISRISRGTLELKKERVEVAAVVRHALESSDPLMQANAHTVTLSLPGQALWVDGDPVRLVQILSNLLNNAARYTPPGGAITLTASREGSTAAIAVRDNGSGIEPDAMERIFEMFNRGSARHVSGGLGIGLAIAKRLAEMHGGSLSVRSDGPARGSEFTIRLPLAADQRGREAVQQRVELSVPDHRILVVDDNVDGAQSLALLLGQLGAQVRVAHDGQEAITIAADWSPEVILLDIGMPGLDGYEVARRLRSSGGTDTVLVAITGWGHEEDRRQASEAGFDYHFTKPVDVDDLARLLTRMHGERKKRR